MDLALTPAKIKGKAIQSSNFYSNKALTFTIASFRLAPYVVSVLVFVVRNFIDF